MCSIDNIKLSISFIVLIKALTALGIFICGIIIASNVQISQAYGNYFTGAGVMSVFIGFFSFLSIFPFHFAVKRHNRAILLASFIFDATMFLLLLTLGTAAFTKSTAVYPKALQEDCLLAYPKIYSQVECEPFLRSDRYAGMRLIWSTYMSDIKTHYSIMITLQRDGGCCGFGPPFRCRNDTRPYPSDRPVTGTSGQYLDQRLECGHFQSFKPRLQYYQQTSSCIQYFDQADEIIGGCRYDLGLGSCVVATVDGYSLGCASVLEDYMHSSTRPAAIYLMTAAAVSLFCAFVNAVMYWKRKYEDVLPAFEIELKNIPKYLSVKDQFMVKPQKDVLVTNGFLSINHRQSDGGR